MLLRDFKKQYLTESNQFLTNVDDIKLWLSKNNIGSPMYFIHPDTLVVDVYKNVKILSKTIAYDLPVQFGIIQGNFDISGIDINSLQGCPNIVHGDFDCAKNKSLRSAIGGPSIVHGNASYNRTSIFNLEGIAKEVYGDLDLRDTQINTISNIHRYIKMVSGSLIMGAIGSYLRGGIVGVMLIRKLKSLSIMQHVHPPKSGIRIDDAVNIINKHLAGDRLLTECQLELQDADLDQYAEL